jgi:hypothetical protein
MAGESRGPASERTEATEPHEGEPNRGTHRHGEPRGEQENAQQRNGEHRGGRRHGRSAPPRRDGVPAPVARLDDARPRRAPKPVPQVAADADDGAGHLPAFLLRPVRIKA